MRNHTNDNPHKINKKNVIFGINAAKIPAAVATPFPPLNPIKYGQPLPMISPTPMIHIKSPAANLKNKIVKNDFKKSTKKMRKKYGIPRARAILVAPVDPEPSKRTSGIPCHDATKYPIDIDPIKYPMRNNIQQRKISFMFRKTFCHLYRIYARYR